MSQKRINISKYIAENKEDLLRKVESGPDDWTVERIQDLLTIKNRQTVQRMISTPDKKGGPIQGYRKGRSMFVPKENLISYIQGDAVLDPEIVRKFINECRRLDYDPNLYLEELIEQTKDYERGEFLIRIEGIDEMPEGSYTAEVVEVE